MRRNIIFVVAAVVVFVAIAYAQSGKNTDLAPPSQAGPRFALFQGSYVPLGTKVPLPPEPVIFKIDTETGRVWSYGAGQIGPNGAWAEKWRLVNDD